MEKTREQVQIVIDVVLVYEKDDRELAQETLACALYALDGEMFDVRNIHKVVLL